MLTDKTCTITSVICRREELERARVICSSVKIAFVGPLTCESQSNLCGNNRFTVISYY